MVIWIANITIWLYLFFCSFLARLTNVTFFVLKIIMFICLRRARRNYFVSFIHIYYSARFFCPSKRNEPKKKSPEMTNFVHTYARYTGLIGATVWPKFRAISGLPTRRDLEDEVLIYKYWIVLRLIFLGFQMPLDLFWKKISILEATKRWA